MSATEYVVILLNFMPALTIYQLKPLLVYLLLVGHSPSTGFTPCINEKYGRIVIAVMVAIT